jgi:hypothetical protein
VADECRVSVAAGDDDGGRRAEGDAAVVGSSVLGVDPQVGEPTGVQRAVVDDWFADEERAAALGGPADPRLCRRPTGRRRLVTAAWIVTRDGPVGRSRWVLAGEVQRATTRGGGRRPGRGDGPSCHCWRAFAHTGTSVTVPFSVVVRSSAASDPSLLFVAEVVAEPSD